MKKAAEELKTFSIDDMFGDTTIAAAKKVFEKYILDGGKAKTLAEELTQEIIIDEIDLINYRTSQKNEPLYLGLLLEWYFVGRYLNSLCDGETQIPIETIKSFVIKDAIVHSSELEDDFLDVFMLYTEEMYMESFIDIMEGFMEMK